VKKAFVPLLIVGVLLVPFGAFVIFSLESTNDNSEIKTLLDAFWWSAVTITTVGYGDLVPVTDSGRIFTIFYMFSGIGIAGIFLSMLTNRVYKKRVERSVEHEVTEPEKTIIKKIEELEKQQKQNTETLEKLLKKLEERN
jgi:voltage-gated potassium channel